MVGPGKHLLDSGPDPHEKGQFEREGASHCKVLGHCVVICAKMAEAVEVPFGLGWAHGIMC